MAGQWPAPEGAGTDAALGQLMAVRRAFLPRPVPGGALVFGSDLSGAPGVYRLDGSGREPQRLAVTGDRMLPVGVTPHGVLVRYDRHGNEAWQPALLTGTGEVRQLTSAGQENHRALALSPDGGRVAFARSPGGTQTELAEIDLATGAERSWLRRDGLWHWRAWHPAGHAAIISHDLHTLVNRSFIVADGQLRALLPTARHVESVVWLPGRILAVTDLGGDFHGLAEVDPQSPERPRRVWFSEDRDVVAVVPDPSGRRAALVVNEGAEDGVHILDLTDGTLTRCPLGPGTVYSDGATEAGHHVAWRADGASLFLAWESATDPAEVYEVPLATPAEPVRWTAVAGPLPPGPVAPQEVEFTSVDGLRITALLYRAGQARGPAVVWFHGGPEGQSRDVYNPMISAWTAAGFHVLAPNVRGSTGYGHRFASLDDRDLRWDSVRDACAAAAWLRDRGHADQLIAAGRSYGGFLTLAALIEGPGLWCAGVAVAGVADWHSFFRNTSSWRRAMRAWEYGDPDGPDGEFLARFSPLSRAGEIGVPLLLIHGENDARVPVSEARAIHAAVPGSELIVYDDEGHHITQHANLVHAHGRAVEFVRQAVAAVSPAASRTDPHHSLAD